jgi:hypothetical protein
MYNGVLSRSFSVASGVAQGSPLSPLLYAIAAQPLAARLRQLQREGTIDAISLPDGNPAPPSHQHADDTTIHTASVESAIVAIHLGVQVFCKASGSALQVAKCKGMVLGTHHSIVGVHADSGIKFVGPTDTIRHLGIPLTTGDQIAASKKLFQDRLTSVWVSIRRWSSFHLSYLGRVHVAKQVLGNKLAYHATFLRPPNNAPDKMQDQLVNAIEGFISRGVSFPDAGHPSHRSRRPARIVASLPAAQGGVAKADMAAHIEGLQGKVAAALLHPGYRPWKSLMKRRLQQHLPLSGQTAIVRSHQVTDHQERIQHLPSRLQGYVQGLQATRLYRAVSHADMSRQQVSIEGLLGNASVLHAGTHQPFTHKSTLPEALASCGTVGAALQQLDLTQPLQPPASTHPLLQLLPQDWQQRLLQPQTAQTRGAWVVNQQQTVVQFVPTKQLYTVMWDRRLGPIDLAMSAAAAAAAAAETDSWESACVVLCPLLKGRPALVQMTPEEPAAPGQPPSPPPADEPYLVGPWSQVQVDPSMWRISPDTPLLNYTVKLATQRVITAKVLKWAPNSGYDYYPTVGLRPKLWRTGVGPCPTDSLHQIDQQQTQRVRQGLGLNHSRGEAGSSSGHRRGIDTEAQLQTTQRARTWLTPVPPRAPWWLRAGDRQPVQSHVQPAAAVVPDTTDPLSPPTEVAQQEWTAVWKRLQQQRLPRKLRSFGWLLLHDALIYGGNQAYLSDYADRQADPLCQHASCHSVPPPPPRISTRSSSRVRNMVGDHQQTSSHLSRKRVRQQRDITEVPVDTLHHMFMECPASAPVLKWLCTLWAQLEPSNPPPHTAALLVADDQSAWQPRRRLAPLWNYLRLQVLFNIWKRRQHLCSGSPDSHATAAETIAVVVGTVIADMRAEWLRVKRDVRAMSGHCLSWFQGRNPTLSEGSFRRFWCHKQVLAVVIPGTPSSPSSKLVICLSCPDA